MTTPFLTRLADARPVHAAPAESDRRSTVAGSEDGVGPVCAIGADSPCDAVGGSARRDVRCSALRSRPGHAVTFRCPRRGAFLREHRVRQAEDRLAFGGVPGGLALVFTSTIGTEIEPRNLARTLDRLIVEAGVRRIRFRDVRHTCASLLLAQRCRRAW